MTTHRRRNSAGSFGIAAPSAGLRGGAGPGIFTFEAKQGGTIYVAVDEGVLVKAGAEVLVSVRHAIGGTDLSQLHEAVKQSF